MTDKHLTNDRPPKPTRGLLLPPTPPRRPTQPLTCTSSRQAADSGGPFFGFRSVQCQARYGAQRYLHLTPKQQRRWGKPRRP